MVFAMRLLFYLYHSDLVIFMSDSNGSHVSRHTLGQRVFLFLGTMDLAITLLLTLAVASIIGTVLQQKVGVDVLWYGG
jgi:ResB-like family protein